MTENITLPSSNKITTFDKIKIVAGAAFISSVAYKLFLTNVVDTPDTLEYLFVGVGALAAAYLVRK